MPNLSVKRFVELLQKSGIVADHLLRDALGQLKSKNGGKPLSDIKFVTENLIEIGLITEWQAEKLLNRKYKGFFLGKYKILGHIGTGGMSTVYLVEHKQMHQRRAVKVLPKKRVNDKTYLERFYLEARASASLDHPNIVRAFDIDQDKGSGVHYLIMEYVDGRDLGKMVKDDGPLNPMDAAGYIAQAADALQYAHDQGLVHRDVKPGNLLVDQNNEVKILDMGLALFKEDDYSLTIAHNEKVLGTADYLAPEQALDSHDVDHRADIYSLGCTLFYVLTGEPPFNDGSLAQRIVSHQTKAPKPISEYRDDCPEILQKIIEKMMEKDPVSRFASCRDVKKTLSDWLAGRPVHIPVFVGAGTSQLPEQEEHTGSSDVLDSDPLDDESSLIEPGNSCSNSMDETLRNRNAILGESSIITGVGGSLVNAISFSDIVAESGIQGSSGKSLMDRQPGKSDSVIDLIQDRSDSETSAAIEAFRVRRLGEREVKKGDAFRRKKILELTPTSLGMVIGAVALISSLATALIISLMSGS